MKRKNIAIGTLMLTLLGVLLVVGQVSATATATQATLTISDSTHGLQKTNFDTAPATVFIYWTADGTVDITIKNRATNAVVASWTEVGSLSSGQYVGEVSTTLGAGIYKVVMTGAPSEGMIAVGTFSAVPEYPLAALAVLLSCFGAFVVFKKRNSIPSLKLK
jgi:hypothetical protein